MHDNRERTAVILVNYNGIEDSVACIKGLCEAEGAESTTILFVDNASAADETAAIRERYPGVITFRNESNGGFSAGNNVGIQYALDNRYGYVLLLNNDTVAAPNMIRLLKGYCDEKTVSAPKILYFTQPDTIWYGGGRINRRTGAAKHSNINRKDTGDTKVKEVTFATGCCMMIKADVFEKIGLLEEDYFMYYEDTDFCTRLAMNGIKIKYVPEARLWHKIGRSAGGSGSPFATYYVTRNRLNYVKKYGSFLDCTAYPFSLASRYIRMAMCKDEAVKRAFRQGIQDHMHGRCGKAEWLGG
ncbi:MAG: glycosyltransferase family 2 protein [Lachnospiraceae bacterium]|nr:glycosyltransferase family 2 protein [Lachnospiraceae bacterium]